MTWFPDMGAVTMVDAGDHVRAVGWLSVEHQFAEGDAPIDFLARLREFATKWCDSTKALGWSVFRGLHTCELCNRCQVQRKFRSSPRRTAVCFPQMILHYVEAHHYRPPDEFIAAVMQSPAPGTDEYRAAVEPFRRLHEQYKERQRQQQIDYAGRWALEQGGSQAAVSEAALRFFGDNSPEICERIRRAMSNAEPGATPDRGGA